MPQPLTTDVGRYVCNEQSTRHRNEDRNQWGKDLPEQSSVWCLSKPGAVYIYMASQSCLKLDMRVS